MKRAVIILAEMVKMHSMTNVSVTCDLISPRYALHNTQSEPDCLMQLTLNGNFMNGNTITEEC